MSDQPTTVNIALAQIFCLDGDRSGNFVRIENALSEARKKRAHLVCFPEAALLGWVNPEAHQRAYPIPGKDSERLANLAKKYNVFISIGLAEKEEKRLYDSSILIDSKGKILLKHRKINILSELMLPPYTPGSGVQVADTKFGRMGTMICADTFEDNILVQMKALKPNLLLVPFGWVKEEKDWPDHGLELQATVQNVAKGVGCTVVGINLVGKISHGPWSGLVYGGQSAASDQNGNILVKGKDRERDIVLVTVEL